jgi:hypothetical protein
MIDVLSVATALVAAIWFYAHKGPSWLPRVAGLLGACSIAALGMLGALWPSIYTLMALAALPAFALLLVSAARPSILQGRSLRLYTGASLVLPPAAFAFQIFWLAGGCRLLGRCV